MSDQVSDCDGNSVTLWIRSLKQGDEEAAQRLWERYFQRVASLARARLRGAAGAIGDEDVALSVLKSVFLNLRENRLPDLTDRTELWPLLVSITNRKCSNEVRRRYAQKRSPSVETQIPDADSLPSHSPTAEQVVELGDQLERLMAALEDETLARIASMRLEGYAVEEIASELGLQGRTVYRKIIRIRSVWESLAET